MGNVRLYGATSGYTELAPPAVAPDGVLSLPSGTGTIAVEPVWNTWTPTYTNLSGGTAEVAVFARVGKIVFCRWSYTLAGAGVAGSIEISLPVTAQHRGMGVGVGLASYLNPGDDTYFGFVSINSATTARLETQLTNITYPKSRLLSSTVPFTWGSGDSLQAQWSYEAA